MLGLQLFIMAFGVRTVFCRDVETDGGGRLYLTEQNFKNAEKIELEDFPDGEIDPVEATEKIYKHIGPNSRTVARRKRLVEKDSKWPNGVVPYQIEGKFNPDQLDIIAKAISEFHKHTCIKWVPYTNQAIHVSIYSPRRFVCWSDVGRLKMKETHGGKQFIALGFIRGSKSIEDSCVRPGFIIHEMMHTIGFHHEHCRPDRDEYVEIVWKNIAKRDRIQFQIERNADTLGLPYDYASVMHYSKYDGSKNQYASIKPKQKTNVVIGMNKGFSAMDIKKINKHYQCKMGTKQNVTKPCGNRYLNCETWKMKGHCKTPAKIEQMKKDCKRSCNFC